MRTISGVFFGREENLGLFSETPAATARRRALDGGSRPAGSFTTSSVPGGTQSG